MYRCTSPRRRSNKDSCRCRRCRFSHLCKILRRRCQCTRVWPRSSSGRSMGRCICHRIQSCLASRHHYNCHRRIVGRRGKPVRGLGLHIHISHRNSGYRSWDRYIGHHMQLACRHSPHGRYHRYKLHLVHKRSLHRCHCMNLWRRNARDRVEGRCSDCHIVPANSDKAPNIRPANKLRSICKLYPDFARMHLVRRNAVNRLQDRCSDRCTRSANSHTISRSFPGYKVHPQGIAHRACLRMDLQHRNVADLLSDRCSDRRRAPRAAHTKLCRFACWNRLWLWSRS